MVEAHSKQPKESYKGKPSAASAESSARLKKTKRDLERLLRKANLPSNIKAQKEKELDAIELRLEGVSFKQRTVKRAKKYHMLRFFERKKAVRKYKQVKNHLNLLEAEIEKTKNDDDQKKQIKKDIKKLKKKLDHCETDVLYTVNFPKHEKYIALYPSNDEDPNDEIIKKGKIKTELEKTEWKKKIQQMVKDNTVPVSLEDILNNNIDQDKLIETQQHVKLLEPDQLKKQKEKKKSTKDKTQAEDDFFE